MNEIYNILAQLTGYKPEIILAPKRPGDIYQAYFNYSKAERLLGWQPAMSFEDGVQATLDFFK